MRARLAKKIYEEHFKHVPLNQANKRLWNKYICRAWKRDNHRRSTYSGRNRRETRLLGYAPRRRHCPPVETVWSDLTKYLRPHVLFIHIERRKLIQRNHSYHFAKKRSTGVLLTEEEFVYNQNNLESLLV